MSGPTGPAGLPVTAGSSVAGTPPHAGTPPRGDSPAALPPLRILLLFAGVFVGLVVLALVLVVLLAPKPTPPVCPDPADACPGPPIVAPPVGSIALPSTTEPSVSPAGSPLPGVSPQPGVSPTPAPSAIAIPIIVPPQLPNLDSPQLVTQVVTASEAGFAVEHPEYWGVEQLDADTIVMGVSFSSVQAGINVRLDAAPAELMSPDALIDQQLASYTQISALAEDFQEDHRVLRPSIGFQPAVLRQFRGTLTTAGGVAPVALTIMAATNGQLTVATTVVASTPDITFPDGMRVQRAAGFLVDPLLKHFRWTSTP